MTPQQIADVLTIAQQHTDRMFSEVIAKLLETSVDSDEQSAGDRTMLTTDEATATPSVPFDLDAPAPTGTWLETGRLAGQTYKWPDGNVDHYDVVISYRGTGGWDGLMLGLGFLPIGEVTGFALGSGGGSKRGITYFVPADDFEHSREKLSMIRGGGQKKRSGFAPGAELPRAYAGLKTAVLGDRIEGKWNVQAVVADENDHDAMLRHTGLQAKLRGLG